MIFPEGLKKGDTIGVVTPSFPLVAEKKQGCIDFFTEKGYRVKLGKCAENLCNFHGYLAGDAKERAEDLNRMFADPEVKAIFCVRGGYGASHLMKYLDFDMIKRNPKIFVGFSDITNLHMAFHKFCGFVTFHGPMAVSNFLEGCEGYTWNSLQAAINMGDVLEFRNPPEHGDFRVIHGGRAEGAVVGGNLSVVARAIGSCFQLDTAGKILFLEDYEESLPALDMYITQLEYAGLFEQVSGILLGDFAGCNNSRYDKTYGLDEFLHDRFDRYPVPIMYHIRSGHETVMGTIPMGAGCVMDADNKSIVFDKNLSHIGCKIF